ncbi:MAG: lysoplasmalogenase [Spirochaetales bacterium]|nr:lysoplasmalogenase [Spirochaetales bacterium]
MTGYYIALSMLTLIFFTVAAVEVVLAGKKLQKLRWFTKPLLVPFIIVLYLLQSGEIAGYLLAGLFTGWIGDLFLLSESKKTSYTGFGFFFLGHILYALAFLQGVPFPSALSVELFAGVLLFSGMIIVLLMKIKMEGSSLYFPAGIYFLVLGIMGFCAYYRFVYISGILPGLTLAGVLLFIISDIILIFSMIHKVAHSQTIVMSTYIAAQVLIVAGMLLWA